MKRIFILLPLFVLINFACHTSDDASKKRVDSYLHIRVAPVTRRSMVDTVRIYGQVRLRQEALLASQFDGRLADFSLLMGDRVQQGKQIGTIIPPAREALLQVMHQIEPGMRPMLEQQIRSIPLYSPMSGVVLEVKHHSGDVVQKGEPIVHIGDLHKLDVHGDLPLRYLPLVRRMKTITVSFVNYPHDPISLPIVAISGKVHVAKQTVPIRLELANPGAEFRPGMLVQLVFPGQEHENALTIPRAALLEEEGVFSAFVLKDKIVEKRVLTIGIMHDDYVEVLSGLAAGERVATQKAYSLTDGMEVVVE